MSDRLNLEQTTAIVIVAAAFLFVAYSEFSNTLSGAAMFRNQIYKNEGWANCYDTDIANDVTVQGRVTVSRLNVETDKYEPQAPYVDECIGPSRVREWKCAEDYNKPIAEERNTFCAVGMTCINGACV